MSNEALSNLLHEERRFPPSEEFARDAVAKADLYDEAAKDRLAFWEEQAQALQWDTEWDQVLDWQPPFAKWFIGGRLNVAVNCVDRHVEAGNGDKVAFHWEGEPGDTRTITYADLKRDVSKAANALTELGVKAGDRVIIYLPMIPEVAIAMLACARLGAAHSVVFGGFSAEALRTRIEDAEATVVITADGGYRRGAPAALKPAVDEAVEKTSTIRNVLVVRRTGQDVAWNDDRDLWWHDVVDKQSEEHKAEAFDSEHPLYILYTSGSTGKPKGILHTTGGYLTQCAYTHRVVFDHKPETDVYWCTADVGWVTGHSYIVYGPLANGATQVMYEGTPDTPHKGRWWELAAKYGVTILYTAPTAIRTFMKWGEEIPNEHDLSKIRLLGSVGEPINPEAWIWYRRVIGADKVPVVDTWWQTETGSIMISPLPGVTAAKPGSAMTPAARHQRRRRRRPGQAGAQRRRWLPRAHRALAVDAARHLGRRRALPRDLLVPVQGPLPRRRRCQEGRGRRHLAAGPGRRRDAGVRPQHLHHRGRVGARLAPEGRRGGRRRRDRPHDRAGHRGVRHPPRRGGRSGR